MADATPELKQEIKELIIEALKLSDITPADIKDDASLFEGEDSLNIDSVDALEIVMALQRKYGVRIDDKNPGRFIIKSVDTIADFVARERAAG
jgi:acyl carrier protein